GEGLDKFQLRSLPLEFHDGGDRCVNTRKLITLAELNVLTAFDRNERRANALERGPRLEIFPAQPERVSREQIVFGRIVLGVDRTRSGQNILRALVRNCYGRAPRRELSSLQIFDAARHRKVIKIP